MSRRTEGPYKVDGAGGRFGAGQIGARHFACRGGGSAESGTGDRAAAGVAPCVGPRTVWRGGFEPGVLHTGHHSVVSRELLRGGKRVWNETGTAPDWSCLRAIPTGFRPAAPR